MTSTRSPITSHVLDTSSGKPASDLKITLEVEASSGWKEIAQAITDKNGRVENLLPTAHHLIAGTYRLHFALAEYFAKQNVVDFYPTAIVTFKIRQTHEHYHIPLLLSPFGYSTYRGS